MSYAIQKLSLVEVSLISNLMPLMIALLSFFILKEQIMKNEIVALIVSFSGVLILALGRDAKISSSEGELEIFALLFLILGTFTQALGFLILK